MGWCRLSATTTQLSLILMYNRQAVVNAVSSLKECVFVCFLLISKAYVQFSRFCSNVRGYFITDKSQQCHVTLVVWKTSSGYDPKKCLPDNVYS